jgi:hypothetical protein
VDAEAPAAVQSRIRELVSELDGTSFAVARRGPAARRQRAYEALLLNPDPVMREIGEELRDGRITLADIVRIPAYADAFREAASRAIDRLAPAVVAEQLEELVADQRRKDAVADRARSRR